MEQDFAGSWNRLFGEKYFTGLVIVLIMNFEDKKTHRELLEIFFNNYLTTRLIK